MARLTHPLGRNECYYGDVGCLKVPLLDFLQIQVLLRKKKGSQNSRAMIVICRCPVVTRLQDFEIEMVVWPSRCFELKLQIANS